MKNFLTFAVICVYFVQHPYLAAAFEISDAHITAVRAGLERMPEMEVEEIQKILNYLEYNRQNPNGILEYAMQGDTCRQNAIEFKRIVAVAQNINENDVDTNLDLTDELEEFSEHQLAWVEADLQRTQSPERAERAMKFLRVMRDGMISHQIFGRDTVELYKSAVKAMDMGCPAESMHQ